MDSANGSCTTPILIMSVFPLLIYILYYATKWIVLYVQLCLLVTVPRVHSQLYVLTVCTLLQFPCPTADIALTLTLYVVLACSPVRIAKTADVKELVQEGVSFVY